MCAFRFKLDSRLEFLPQNLHPPTLLAPGVRPTVGTCGQRGPRFHSLLGTKRRVSLLEVLNVRHDEGLQVDD